MLEEKTRLPSRLSQHGMRHFLPSAAHAFVPPNRLFDIVVVRCAVSVRFAAAVAGHASAVGASAGGGQQGRNNRGDSRISACVLENVVVRNIRDRRDLD